MPGDICLRTEKTSEVRKTNLTIFSRSFKKERTTKLEVTFVSPVENYLYKIQKKTFEGLLTRMYQRDNPTRLKVKSS